MDVGRGFFLVFVFYILLSSNTVVAQTIVETLPGFPGTLPFKLETGYVGVGKNEEIQLFYYFIESESNPEEDPLLLWITGGPGCSGFSGLAYEIGPLQFDTKHFDGSFPSLHLNPYSWTKIASIIFIDSPVGTGFSYATTTEGYHSSDTKAVNDTYMFLQKWLLNHPKFIKNRLYVAGDSYGGKIIPRIAWEIKKGIQKGFEPRMALQGYLIGNPVTYIPTDLNSRIPFAHRLALISDAYYELAKSSCDGEYENPDPENYKCLYALQPIQQGTITDWVRCNNSISYEQETESVVDYHKLFIETESQVLIYSGDHDLDIPYIGTLEWIRSLNLTMDSNWRPWLVNGQIAGYTERYTYAEAKKYYLTFATVKGAGHTAPEYKPKECLAMLERWLSFYPL